MDILIDFLKGLHRFAIWLFLAIGIVFTLVAIFHYANKRRLAAPIFELMVGLAFLIFAFMLKYPDFGAKPSPPLNSAIPKPGFEEFQAPPLPEISPPAEAAETHLVSFSSIASWQEKHVSNVADKHRVFIGDNYVLWQLKARPTANSDGTVGLYKALDLDVSRARALNLNFHVWISHSVGQTLPARVVIDYVDDDQSEQQWEHGFSIYGKGSMDNVSHIQRGVWKSFSFDLMNGQLQNPSRLTRITLCGSGKDFRAGIGGLMLTQ